MGDQNIQQGQQGGAAAQGAVVVDKNKSNEAYIKEAEASYIIPDLVRDKFSDLVKLIYETESMNQEEREYWMQILPIMGEDQIVKFREILVNEKEQLAKLDQEYQQEVSKLNQREPVKQIDEEAMKKKMQEIAEKEKAQQAEEQSKEAELLKALDSL